jgi:FKBP-type peptidyl-prolyl cis-trans isomerase
MKSTFIVALISLIGFSASAQVAKKKPLPVKKPVTTAAAKPMLKTNLDSACYALGLNVAASFKSGGLTTINYEAFNRGLKDAFQKANPALSPQQCQEAVTTLFNSFSKQREAEEMKNHMPAINAGKAFLAANKAKPGVVTTASGLQYQMITPGTGAKPTLNDRVTVHYKGTLIDGTQFDSSYDRGEPASFGLTQVISGWTEALQLMQEGSKYHFVIPYSLGYGANASGKIPAFSVLEFDIELLKVEAQ